MIVAARCDHRHCAVVLDAVRILVDALMQLRGSTQRQRPEKRCGDANHNKRAPVIICGTRELAHRIAIFWLARFLRKKFLRV